MHLFCIQYKTKKTNEYCRIFLAGGDQRYLCFSVPPYSENKLQLHIGLLPRANATGSPISRREQQEKPSRRHSSSDRRGDVLTMPNRGFTSRAPEIDVCRVYKLISSSSPNVCCYMQLYDRNDMQYITACGGDHIFLFLKCLS